MSLCLELLLKFQTSCFNAFIHLEEIFPKCHFLACHLQHPNTTVQKGTWRQAMGFRGLY